MTTYAKAAPRKADVPYSEAAERAVLGAVLIDEEVAWAEGVGSIPIADFFVDVHRAIWEAMLRLRTERTAVSGVTVCDMLAKLVYIDACDRLVAPDRIEEFVCDLYNETWASHGCSAHARMVMEYAERRRLISAGITQINAAMRGERVEKPIYERDEYAGVEF